MMQKKSIGCQGPHLYVLKSQHAPAGMDADTVCARKLPEAASDYRESR